MYFEAKECFSFHLVLSRVIGLAHGYKVIDKCYVIVIRSEVKRERERELAEGWYL